ncbi:MAG: AAA family ATPase [Sphingopyxis sp.]|uniref:AAA family ATPase n=1 Tax=Sphingopyxis sp. TaxID=1908224 RepID=UPI002ABCEF71|nr:AAA family ATPase [Sphingopyxis sp.]MDZ3833438.1 AAA family ATPase [Sphingopyxis sp.]
MIIELNGHAGVGKLTIGRLLAEALGARLIDNHTLYDPAFATTDFGSEAFFDTVRAVRAIAFERAAALPQATAIILMIAPSQRRAWGEEWQAAIRSLADARRARLYGVHLSCADVERARRIAAPDRVRSRKLSDAAVVGDGMARPILLDHCDAVFDIDVTDRSADSAAAAIRRWVMV